MPGMNLRLQKLKETRDLRYIYENELDKFCFAHEMGYGDFQVLASRAASDKMLCDKAFYIAKNPKYDGYQRGLASMVYIFFNKKTSATCARSEALLRELCEINLLVTVLKSEYFKQRIG